MPRVRSKEHRGVGELSIVRVTRLREGIADSQNVLFRLIGDFGA